MLLSCQVVPEPIKYKNIAYLIQKNKCHIYCYLSGFSIYVLLHSVEHINSYTYQFTIYSTQILHFHITIFAIT